MTGRISTPFFYLTAAKDAGPCEWTFDKAGRLYVYHGGHPVSPLGAIVSAQAASGSLIKEICGADFKLKRIKRLKGKNYALQDVVVIELPEGHVLLDWRSLDDGEEDLAIQFEGTPQERPECLQEFYSDDDHAVNTRATLIGKSPLSLDFVGRPTVIFFLHTRPENIPG